MTSPTTLPRVFSWLALTLCLLAALPPLARAELMLNPTRVVFSKNQRAAQVELINNGAAAASYRISLVNRRMTLTGEFDNITTAAEGEQFADTMLSYSPRQITLQPGAAQVVRVMVRKPDALAEGEYRSHLHFEKLPDTSAANSAEAGVAQQQIGVVVTTLIGTSIPVIVRHGATGASVTLGALALSKASKGEAPVLSFQIERSGSSSVYGDLTASFTPQGGAEKVLGQAGGVAVYTPNRLRRAAMTLSVPAGTTLARGTLRLAYRERPEAGGKLLAEAAYPLP